MWIGLVSSQPQQPSGNAHTGQRGRRGGEEVGLGVQAGQGGPIGAWDRRTGGRLSWLSNFGSAQWLGSLLWIPWILW